MKYLYDLWTGKVQICQFKLFTLNCHILTVQFVRKFVFLFKHLLINYKKMYPTNISNSLFVAVTYDR